jgi:hypothetical protein
MRYDATTQAIAALFVALADSGGTLVKAQEILANALADGVITDPLARSILSACAKAPADERLEHKPSAAVDIGILKEKGFV